MTGLEPERDGDGTDTTEKETTLNTEKEAKRKDLNAASYAELKMVPLFGKILAKRPIEAKPLNSWAQVEALKYIGEERVKNLQKCFVIHEDDEWEEISQASEKIEGKSDKAKCEKEHEGASTKAIPCIEIRIVL